MVNWITFNSSNQKSEDPEATFAGKSFVKYRGAPTKAKKKKQALETKKKQVVLIQHESESIKECLSMLINTVNEQLIINVVDKTEFIEEEHMIVDPATVNKPIDPVINH